MPTWPKDADGLSLDQRQLLMLMATGQYNVTEACAQVNITSRTFQNWMRQPEFKTAVDNLYTKEDIANLKKTLNISAQGTVEVLEAAMQDAVKQVRVTCTCPNPKCGQTFSQMIEVADWGARLRAVENLLKISGILLERRESKVDISVSYKLSMYEQMGLLRWERGEQIPPHLETRLRELGKIGDRLALPAAHIEGEFREVTNEDSQPEQQ